MEYQLGNIITSWITSNIIFLANIWFFRAINCSKNTIYLREQQHLQNMIIGNISLAFQHNLTADGHKIQLVEFNDMRHPHLDRTKAAISRDSTTVSKK